MKEKKMPSRVLALFVAILVFFGSMLVISVAATAGYTVRTQPVNWITDDGVNLSATLFVPDGASEQSPAAGVLVCPGGNTPHLFYASYCIELARRGYVVLSYDYYGTMASDMAATGSSGAVAAMKYLTSLSFVDTSRLAATGHSNGGAQAAAAIASPYTANAAKRSVMFIGCGVSAKDTTAFPNTNVGVVWGKLDEVGQGTVWDVYHKDKLNFSGFALLTGLDSKSVEVGKWYGDPAANTGRIVYTPTIFHAMSNVAPNSVPSILSYIDTTLGGNTKGIAPTSLIYLWQELAVLTAAISLCVMIFPVGSLLADTAFFASLKRPVPEASAKADVKFWVFLLVPGIISAALVKTTVMQGQTILGKAPHLFNVQSTNGFIWWFFLSAVIAVAFFAVRLATDRTLDRQRVLSGLRTSPANLGKAVLFGLATVFVPYLCGVIGERTVGWYGRIFQTYFSSVSANRLGQFPVYFIMFGILFTVYAFVQADGLRLQNAKPRTTYLLTLLANALPAVLFLGALYGKMILTRITPITGREMSRAQGALMGMLLLYFVISKAVTYFYKKTGNIYACAMVNAAFVTWLSVNTQQLIV